MSKKLLTDGEKEYLLNLEMINVGKIRNIFIGYSKMDIHFINYISFNGDMFDNHLRCPVTEHITLDIKSCYFNFKGIVRLKEYTREELNL